MAPIEADVKGAEKIGNVGFSPDGTRRGLRCNMGIRSNSGAPSVPDRNQPAATRIEPQHQNAKALAVRMCHACETIPADLRRPGFADLKSVHAVGQPDAIAPHGANRHCDHMGDVAAGVVFYAACQRACLKVAIRPGWAAGAVAGADSRSCACASSGVSEYLMMADWSNTNSGR